MSKPKAPATATSRSSKPSLKAPSPARVFSALTRAISTTGGYNLEGYAPEFDMPKGAQIIDGPVKPAKPRANNSITAPTGSRST